MLDESPIYQDSPRQAFPSGMSVASSARSNRSMIDNMAKDKIYRWITFRMKFNKDYLTDMFRAQGDRFSPSDLPASSMMTHYLRDPNTKRLGTMLKDKYSAEGFGRLSGNLYFLFGLPRVKHINEEYYRTVDPDAENESIAESASQERRPNMDAGMPPADDQDESNIYARSIKQPTLAESRRDPSFRRDVIEQNDSSANAVPKVHDRAQSSQKREPVYGDYIRSDFGATKAENASPKVHDRAQRSQKREPVYGDFIRSDFGASKKEPTYIGQSRNFGATRQGPSYLGQSRKERDDKQWREIEKSTRNDPYKEQFFFKGIN